MTQQSISLAKRLGAAWRVLTTPHITTRRLSRRQALDMMTKRFEFRWPSWREGVVQWQTVDLRTYMEEGFSGNAIIYETLMYKGKASLAAPLHAYVGNIDNPEPAPPEHPLSKLLARPNPDQDMDSFRLLMSIYLNLTGNCYILCDRPTASAPPDALYLLRPDYMFILPEKGKIKAFMYKPEGAALRDADFYLPQDVIHIKLPNPADPLGGMGYGLSPVTPIGKVVDVDNALTAFLKLWIDNAPNMPFVLTYDTELDEGVADEIKERYRELHGGSENWTDIMVADQGASIQKIGYSFDEMGFQSIDDRNEPRMTGPFGVSPILIASRVGLDNSAYANITTYKRTFWTDTMVPELMLQESPLRYYLSTPDGGFVRYDLSAIPELREDVSAQVTSAKVMFDMGTPPRIAYQTVGLRVARYPGDDVGYLPFNLLPVGRPAPPPALPSGQPTGEAPAGEGEPTSAVEEERDSEGPSKTGKKKVAIT